MQSTDQPNRAVTSGPVGGDAVFAHFDLDAARRYDKWYQTDAGHRMARAEERLLAALLRRLPGARSILDVGCGTGYFTRWASGARCRRDFVLRRTVTRTSSRRGH